MLAAYEFSFVDDSTSGQLELADIQNCWFQQDSVLARNDAMICDYLYDKFSGSRVGSHSTVS